MICFMSQYRSVSKEIGYGLDDQVSVLHSLVCLLGVVFKYRERCALGKPV